MTAPGATDPFGAPAASGAGPTPAPGWMRMGRRAWRIVAIVPVVALVLCSFSSDLVAVFGGDPFGVWQLLPAGPVSGDWIGAELSSTAFLLVAIALARRKRSGFWLALAMTGGALIVQGSWLDHPVAAAAAGLVGAILIATHRRYEVGTSQRVARLAAMLVLAGIALAVSAGIVSSAGDVGQVVVDAVGSLLDLATPGPLPGIAVVGTILIVARLGYLIAAALALDPVEDERPPERVAAARQALARLGSGSLVPYHGGPMCTAVADAEGRAAMAVAVAGRSVVALGDPAGDPLAGRRLLEAWRTGCERRDVVPAIYQASAGLVASLRRAGWHAILVGREAIVDPVAFDLRASTVANLRHTVTRSRRGGTQTLWSTDGLAGLGNPSLVERLAALDQDWRRRAGPQLGFTVGQFDPLDRTRSAVAVAVNGEGEPLAFAMFRPTGADGGWMLDIMRRSRSGVPGSVEACVLAAIQGFAAMGVRRLSLGLAPLAGLDPAVGPPAERLLARAAAVIRPIYDHKGLAFFKNKFAPEWEPRYLVVVHWWDLPGALAALVRLHLGGSWPRVVRSVVVGLVPAR